MTRYTIVLMLILAGAAQAQQTADWFPFTAKSNPAAGEIGMQDWLDRPAGKFGRIARDGERLMYNHYCPAEQLAKVHLASVNASDYEHMEP